MSKRKKVKKKNGIIKGFHKGNFSILILIVNIIQIAVALYCKFS